MPNWKKVALSGSDAAFASVTSSNGIINYGRLTMDGSVTPREIVFSNNIASYQDGQISGTTLELRASSTRRVFVDSTGVQLSGSTGINGDLIVTGSAAIGTSSIGPSENTLTLGARDATNEGGQLGLNAPGGTYTSASFFDNWQNNVRILRGSNATSDATVASWNLHTKQMVLAAYTSPSSFTGTVAGLLAFDSAGNVLTTAAGGWNSNFCSNSRNSLGHYLNWRYNHYFRYNHIRRFYLRSYKFQFIRHSRHY